MARWKKDTGNDAASVGDAETAAPVGDAEPNAPAGTVAADEAPVAKGAGKAAPPAAAPADAPVNPHAVTRQNHEAALLKAFADLREMIAGKAPMMAELLRRIMMQPDVVDHLCRIRHDVLAEFAAKRHQ